MLGQALRDQAAEYIRRTTGRVWNDHTHGSCRIGLRASKTGDGRQRGSARSQMQKNPAGKFHFKPPCPFTSLDHLVGQLLEVQRDVEAERPGRLQVDDELEFRRL